jgi:hypothetical protein
MLELANNSDSPIAHTCIHFPDYPEEDLSPGQDSITGKLRTICPTLFFTLTSLEKDFIDNLGVTHLSRVDSPTSHPSSCLPNHALGSTPFLPSVSLDTHHTLFTPTLDLHTTMNSPFPDAHTTKSATKHTFYFPFGGYGPLFYHL